MAKKLIQIVNSIEANQNGYDKNDNTIKTTLEHPEKKGSAFQRVQSKNLLDLHKQA